MDVLGTFNKLTVQLFLAPLQFFQPLKEQVDIPISFTRQLLLTLDGNFILRDARKVLWGNPSKKFKRVSGEISGANISSPKEIHKKGFFFFFIMSHYYKESYQNFSYSGANYEFI